MELVKWNAARRAIVEAKSVDEVKQIRDKAEAMRAYAKQVGEGLEVQNGICEIKLRAERRMGEMLKETITPGGDRKSSGYNDHLILKKTKEDKRENTLPITQTESKRYQKIADLPDERFEEIIQETKEAEKELTEALMLNTAKKIDREVKIQEQREGIEKGTIKLPEGKYEVIVIDPPWNYGRKYDPSSSRSASPYPEMTQTELKKIKLPYSENSILWLWTTHKFIWAAMELMNFWGFEYKAILVWNKQNMGLGSWLRMQCEFCLLGVRGQPLWNLTNERDIISNARNAHSEKPQAFYDMVDKLCIGRKLDYFARKAREGWDVYGDEVV